MEKKYINHIKCTICEKAMDTGMCYTKLGMWIKTKIITRRHWHTKAEVYGKKMFGIYMPSTVKKRDA